MHSFVPSLGFPLRLARPGPQVSSSRSPRSEGRGSGVGPLLPASRRPVLIRPERREERPAFSREPGDRGRSGGPAGVGTLPAAQGGTLGRNRWCGCGTAHSLPKRGSPSTASPSLFLSSWDSPVPARLGVPDWPGRREGRTAFRRGQEAF